MHSGGRRQQEGREMAEHKVGAREEWQAARDELAKLEAEHAKRGEEIKKKRLELRKVEQAKAKPALIQTRSSLVGAYSP